MTQTVTPPVNIICMKWGQKYGPDYVNKLARMVKRHLKRPHRFVCLTDDGKGLDQGIDVFPIPDLPVSLDHLTGPDRAWKKLTTFSSQLYDLQGMAMFLDLDIVITDDMDPFFDLPGDVLIIKEWKQNHGLGNSSVYRFTVGAHPDVLSYFAEHLEDICVKHRHEQAYLCHFLNQKGALGFWPEGWCASFKRNCMHPFPKSLFVEPQLPEHTKILIFHGHPLPDEAIIGKTGKWYRYARPATWLKDLWK